MLKIYEYNGAIFQFEEGEQPESAVEVTAKPPEKAAKPANKGRTVKTK